MKSFNKITSLLILSLLIGFTACKEEIKYDPTEIPGNAQVYFPNALPAKIELSNDLTVTSYNVELRRIDKTAALTVNLAVENENPDIFTIPASVSFAAGEEVANITINYDPNQLEYDLYLPVTLSVSDEIATPYGNASYAFTAGIPAPWETLGMATYTDDFVSAFFAISKESYEVEIQRNLVTPGIYRLVNPYGEAYPFNEPGDWDENKDYYLVIDATDPDGVYIPHPQNTGMDWSYGEFLVSSMAGYYIAGESTLEEQKTAGNCGRFVDNGVITFPAQTLLISMSNYENGNFFPANSNGWFQIVFPGVVLADYSAEIEYTGYLTDPSGDIYATAKVTLGGDVAYGKVALVPGNMAESVVDGIIDGSTESRKIDTGGDVSFPLSAAGRYTFVLVAYDAEDEVQDAASVSFNYVPSPVIYPVENFYGDYIMSGLSVLEGSPYSMNVTIAAADTKPNTLVITGIDLADNLTATFLVTGLMYIAPQNLSDFYDNEYEETVTNVNLQTIDAEKKSVSAPMIFTRLESGALVLAPDSYATGYVIYGDDEAGDTYPYNSYIDIEFTPAISGTSFAKRSSASTLKTGNRIKTGYFGKTSTAKTIKNSMFGLSIKNKVSRSTVLDKTETIPLR